MQPVAPFPSRKDAAADALRVPPHSQEAEQAVLGGLMLDNSTWEQVSGTVFEDFDHSPAKGLNRYRAAIELENGAFLYSDTSDVYLLDTGVVLVFPTFAAPGTPVRVVSGLEEISVFTLYDIRGRVILDQKLEDVATEVGLPNLPAGVYVWIVSESKKRPVKCGKLMIQPGR